MDMFEYQEQFERLLEKGHPDLERFLYYVKKGDEHWEWQGMRSDVEANKFVFNGKTTSAERAFFLMALGKLDRKTLVLRKCGNKRCVRPSHLYLGTSKNVSKVSPNGKCYKRLEGGIKANANGLDSNYRCSLRDRE